MTNGLEMKTLQNFLQSSQFGSLAHNDVGCHKELRTTGSQTDAADSQATVLLNSWFPRDACVHIKSVG